MSHGNYHGETLSDDDDGAIDITELPNEYRIKLNGFLRNACHDGHETLTRVLLEKGADVNYVSPTASLPTALHVAVIQGRDKIVPVLIPHANETTIQSVLSFATEHQSKLANIIRLLQKNPPITTTTTTTTSTSTQRENETQTIPTPSTEESETQTPSVLPTTMDTDSPTPPATPPVSALPKTDAEQSVSLAKTGEFPISASGDDVVQKKEVAI